ncbi:helix-turn-helix domain-containing protein [Nonomuraea sp. NPDC055795]
MKELAGRLSALDPDAGAALQVIAYFDRLVEARAGLEAIVRGAAVLAGCPVRLVDEERNVRVRVLADGRRSGPAADRWHERVDQGWPVGAAPGGAARLWLEMPGPAGPVHAVVLERAAVAARDVLDRTRGRAPSRDDPALVELVLDGTAPEQARLRAARSLGLEVTGEARAVAFAGGDARIVPAGADPGPAPPARRTGVGPAVPVRELPASWPLARLALRLAADGTDQDPGPRVVLYDNLGGLAALAAAVPAGADPVPDVHALEHAASAAPWMLATLHAIAYAVSLRAAAAQLPVHHSTLQDRLAHAEHLLGWTIRDPEGRLRLQLALTLRRLHRHP